MIHIRLAQLRKEVGLTQNELAKKLNITRSALSLYELGKRDPDTETLCKIAGFFGVSVDYFVGRTDIRNLEVNSNDEACNFHNLDLYDLPEEAILQVKEYIEFVKQKYNPNGSLNKK
jgi:transcriptional regulator with XRE-family HTH domain